eukprot:gene20678-23485_t
MEANKDDRIRKVDQDGEDLELEPAKRQKGCDIDDDCVQVETVEEDETGVAPVSDVKQSEQRELMCILCMEEGSVESPLLSEHQCAQCNKDAWKICVPVSGLADKTLSAETRALLLYKFGIIRQLIGKSNVAVWNPEQGKMHFSLPREFAEGNSNKMCCLTVTVPMEADRILNNTITFNNTVWDEIESEVESGTSGSGEMRESDAAIQWLLSFTRHAGHQILSMMTEADWEQTLDPTKSEDTAAALQTIQSSIAVHRSQVQSVEVVPETSSA